MIKALSWCEEGGGGREKPGENIVRDCERPLTARVVHPPLLNMSIALSLGHDAVPPSQVAELAELITQWAISSNFQLGREHRFEGVTRYQQTDPRHAGRKLSIDPDPEFNEGSGPGAKRCVFLSVSIICGGACAQYRTWYTFFP